MKGVFPKVAMLPSGIAIAYGHSFIKDCQCLLPFFQLGLPLPTAIPPSTVGLPLPTAILLSRIAIAYCNLEFQAILPGTPRTSFLFHIGNITA